MVDMRVRCGFVRKIDFKFQLSADLCTVPLFLWSSTFIIRRRLTTTTINTLMLMAAMWLLFALR